MSVARFSLLVALVWGALAAVAVLLAARRPSGSPDRGDRSLEIQPSRVGLGDLLAGAAVGAAGFFVSVVVGTLVVDLGVFGAMSVAYLFAVVAAPLAAATVLGAAVRARVRGPAGGRAGRAAITRPALAVCAAALLLVPIGIYATHIEPAMLDVDRPAALVVAPERSGAMPITIGVLTDLQTPTIGAREHWVVDRLLAAHPDVILLPGDIVQAEPHEFERELPALRELLGRLSAPGGVYLVGGDVDQPLDRLPRMVEGTGVRYLDDEVVTASVGDRTVSIGGIGLDYASPEALAVVDELETAPGADDVRILVAHRPDPVLGLRPGSRIDLQVSGHTHGGQISVPFVGPLLTLTGVPRWVAAGGLHELDGNAIYVGRGVGLERGQAPQIRFGVRPNIGVLTIEG